MPSNSPEPLARVAAEPDREAQILAAAAELFAEHGFEATSMRDIAGRIALSKPAIYHWFRDKDEIFERIIVRSVERLCLHTEREVGGNAPARERFKRFMEAHAQFFYENQSAYVTANYGFGGLRHSPGRDEAIRWRDRHERNLRAIIEDGIETGDFTPMDVSLASRAILSSLTGMARWYRSTGKLSPREIARQFSQLYLRGLGNPTTPQG